MSLTNPNKLITEERLSDFYQQILPYMGGMPEVVNNKFSKSNLYSTDEKMIGQWIDGKPLYQKVVQLTSSDIPNGNIKYKNHDISDLDYVVYLSGMIRQNDNVSFTALPRVQDNSAANLMGLDINKTQLLIKGRGTTFTETFNGGFVLIKYTKTTDSPISIGSDTDYSTDEKIIGTWIDGKPIYQKTVTNLSITLSSSWDNLISIQDCGLILSVNVIGTYSGDTYVGFIDSRLSGTQVQMKSTSALSSIVVDTATIQYTKTTA